MHRPCTVGWRNLLREGCRRMCYGLLHSIGSIDWATVTNWDVGQSTPLSAQRGLRRRNGAMVFCGSIFDAVVQRSSEVNAIENFRPVVAKRETKFPSYKGRAEMPGPYQTSSRCQISPGTRLVLTALPFSGKG